MRALITAYTFSASTGEVTFTALADPLEKVRILGIWNDTDGIKLYDPHTTGYNGSVTSNVLKLDVDTSAMSNGDDLLIFYELDTLQDVLTQLVAIHGHTQSIDGKTPALDSGQVPVLDAGAATLLFDILGYITNVDSKLAALGPAFKIGSMPVTISPDDDVNVTLAALLAKVIAAPSTEAKQDAANALLTTIAGKDFATQTTLAALLAKVIAAPATEAKQDTGNSAIVAVNTSIGTTNTEIGGLTETAPATDTASSGLNGRLQRIAQRLTTLITNLGTWVFGAGTSAAAARVTLASDDPAVATLGATSGAAVITDANGTVQQYLRGLVKQWIAGTLVIGTGSNVIGKTYIAYQTTKALTSAAISTTTSGEQTIVSGTASQTIRVFRLSFTVSAATTVTIKDAAGGNTLASYDLVANGSLILEATDGEPYFVTASSGAFIISSSATANIKGNIQYTKS